MRENDIILINPTETSEGLKPVRMETDFSRFAHLFHQFGTDCKLMFEIMIFINHEYQYDINLFNNNFIKETGEDTGYRVVFDVKKFGKFFNYTESNLWRKHTNPFYSIKNQNKKSDFYITNIGNALYRLYTEKLDLTNKVGLTSSNKSIELIQSIRDPDTNRGLRGKYIIEVLLGSKFIEAISRSYVNLSSDDIIRLNKHKNNLAIPYLHFSALGSYMMKEKLKSWDFNFDEICDVCNVKVKVPRDAKQRLKDKIKKINERSDLDLEIEFYKKTETSRYSYGVRIIFSNFGFQENEPLKNLSYKNAMLTEWLRSLIPYYKSKYGYKYHNNNAFLKWLENSNKDDVHKRKSFADLYRMYFGKDEGIYSRTIDALMRDPLKEIPTSITLIDGDNSTSVESSTKGV